MRKYLVLIICLFSFHAFADVKAFIPKQNNELPDAYGIKIIDIMGKEESFEIASHRLNNGLFEFVTKDDIWNWIVMDNIKRIEFDKRFSKIIVIKEKND